MAYIPGFKNDIFISYSHGDNEGISLEGNGWISYFERRLRMRLKQILGVPPEIWFDTRRLGGEVNFNQEIAVIRQL
jgi:hypothetical protein